MNNELFNAEIITSKSNSTIVKIGKLLNKKARNEEQMFLCAGIKLFEEAFNFNAKIPYIVIKNDSVFSDEITEKIKITQKNGTKILCVSSPVFEKLTDEKAPQGIIAVCQYLSNVNEYSTAVENSYKNEKIIILESVRDPGNIGTIIRNAAAFGIDRLILSSDCADLYSSKVVRAAMGAIFKVNIDIVSDLVSTIKILKNQGKRVITAALLDTSLVLSNNTISKDDVVIIGNEGHGASKEVIEASDETIIIPISANTESLNAAIAAAIFMWELSK